MVGVWVPGCSLPFKGVAALIGLPDQVFQWAPTSTSGLCSILGMGLSVVLF